MQKPKKLRKKKKSQILILNWQALLHNVERIRIEINSVCRFRQRCFLFFNDLSISGISNMSILNTDLLIVCNIGALLVVKLCLLCFRWKQNFNLSRLFKCSLILTANIYGITIVAFMFINSSLLRSPGYISEYLWQI